MLQWTLGCRHLFKLAFLFSSGKYQEVKLLDHMAVLFSISWGTSVLFTTVAAPIYIPTSSARGFPPPYSLASTWYLFFLMMVILAGVQWYLIVVLLAFPDNEWCWAYFHVSPGHLYVFFRKISIQAHCLNFLSFFDVELNEFFVYFGY